MSEKRINEVTMGGSPVTLLGRALTVGERAPDFTALRTDLSLYSLKDSEDHIKIISVVPSIDTGICEMQTVRFNQEATNLSDVVVFTLSVDLPFAQGRFCGAKEIDKVIMLSDHRTLDFGLKYGFVIEELRLLSRGLIVLDRDNTIKYIQYLKEVKEHPDYDAALNVVRTLLQRE